MLYTNSHKIALPALMENDCFYNPAILSLLYYAAENKINTENRSNYGNVYGFDYGNGYTSTTTENLTSNYCLENACSKFLNMKGRLYDPVIARFFSPDPHIQIPTFTQNFNRYSYCLNNPLHYTDPNGEFIWAIAAMIVYGGIKILSGNWNGGESAKQTFMAGLSALFIPSAGVTGLGLLQFGAQQAGNMFLAQHASINITAGNFSFSVSPGLGFNPSSGLTWGVNAGASYENNGWIFSVGGGVGKDYAGWNVRAGHEYFSAGYGMTHYGGEHAQTTGTLAAYWWKGGSFRIENDFLAGTGDKWRTSAIELSQGPFSIGKYVYSNAPDRTIAEDQYDKSYKSEFWNKVGKRTYPDSEISSSPVWFGYRYGNNVIRIGYDHPIVQDITQNGWHLLTNAPLLYTPYWKQPSRYNYNGYYSPFSLYY